MKPFPRQTTGKPSSNTDQSSCTLYESASRGDNDINGETTQKLLQNAHLVHAILLTDRLDLKNLRILDESSIALHTTNVDEFMRRHWKELRSPATQDEPIWRGTANEMERLSSGACRTMKRAFFEYAMRAAEEDCNFTPYCSMVHALVTGIQQHLVPHRTDLHDVWLNDDSVMDIESVDSMLIPLIPAADVLSRLEAPCRTCSTLAWLQMVRSAEGSVSDKYGMSVVEYAVASVVFLLLKTDVCSMDIINVVLRNNAPTIYSIGNEYERERFQKTYGNFDSCPTPNTKDWLDRIWQQCDKDGGCIPLNISDIQRAIRSTGFIDELLFSKSRFSMPEVFDFDTAQINQIRGICRAAVVGSVLALHCINLTSVSISKFNEFPLDDDLRRYRDRISCSLLENSKEAKEFEKNVALSIIGLAKFLKPSLSKEHEKSLERMTVFTVRGEDRVLDVLDKRLRILFKQACRVSANNTVFAGNCGQSITGVVRTEKGINGIFVSQKDYWCQQTMKLASQQGFNLFADEIANASFMAKRILDVAWNNFGDYLLVKLFVTVSKDREWID